MYEHFKKGVNLGGWLSQFDLHEIEGHGYMANGEIPRILTDESLIKQCVLIWTTLAKRYLNRKNPAMVFELINEIHDPVSYYWKELYKRLVSEIRAIDKERVILIGTTEDRIAWLRDFREILEKHHIGRAYWNYKIMNFGLVDRSGRVVDDELRKTVFR